MITSTPNTLQDYSDLPPAAPVKPGGYIPERRPTLDNLNHNLNALPDLLSSPSRVLNPINHPPTRLDSDPGFPVRTLNTPILNLPSAVLQSVGKAQRTFPCTFPGCDKVYAHRSTLSQHFHNVHKGKRYRCQEPGCNKAFTKINALTIHSHVHTQEPFYCNVPSCNQSFPNNSKLIEHKREVHRPNPSTKTLQCTICSLTLSRPDNLSYHMNAHFGLTPYNCRIAECNKSFCSPAACRRHEKTHTTL